MKPRSRIAMTITAADPGAPADAPAADPAPADPAAPPADAGAPAVTPAPADAPAGLPVSANGRFHCVICVTGIETGDKRIFETLTWRDLPLPFMADDKNHPEHEEAVLVGNIDTIKMVGQEAHGWGPYLSEPSEEAQYLIDLIKSGELRGVSADIDNVEYEVLWPVPIEGEDVTFDPDTGEPIFPPTPTETIDGKEYDVMKIEDPLLRVTEGRIMGATAIPFPALQECWVEDDSGSGMLALAAGGAQVMRRQQVTGYVNSLTAASAPTVERMVPIAGREGAPSRFTFPEVPPAEWFELPEAPGPMPLTITDEGQVFGHLATWGECHIGFGGECVEPPASASNYARFHVGEIPVAPVGRVSVGRLTFGSGGHANAAFGPEAARAHYDQTCNVAADIRAVDGQYGIWVCGAMRSNLTLSQVREVMSAPPSGDWRRFGRDLELVAALAVNVPGFNTVRADGSLVASAVRVRKDEGLIASLIVSHPAPALTAATETTGMPDHVVAHLRDLLADSLGLGRDARIAALVASVRGGK